jgi:hypothetical protein
VGALRGALVGAFEGALRGALVGARTSGTGGTKMLVTAPKQALSALDIFY